MPQIQAFLLLILLLAAHSGHGQSSAKYSYRVERIVSDTLDYIQGDWDFDHLELEGKRNSRTGYYATGLWVSESSFGMRLSEAAVSGEIVRENGKILLKCEDNYDGKAGDIYEIHCVKRRGLQLIHRQQDYSYIFPDFPPPHDVIYFFERRE